MTKVNIILNENKTSIDQSQHFSLLIAMENKKLPVKYGCLMGVCGVCEVKIVKGMENIEYFEEPMLDLDKDSILPCCCVAKGDIEISNI